MMKVSQLLASTQLTGSGDGVMALPTSKHFTSICKWGPGTTAGVIVVEAAPSVDFTGTWFTVKTFTWGTQNTIDVDKGVVGPFLALRARITTTVVTTNEGATVTLVEN